MPMERHTVVTDRPCGALAKRLVRTLPEEASASFAISRVPLSYLLSLLLRLFRLYDEHSNSRNPRVVSGKHCP